MPKKLDLVGQAFGYLTVIEKGKGYIRPNGKSKTTTWICSCKCGNTAEVVSSSLIKGVSKSCGCYRREERTKKRLDLTGQTFHYLTALKMAEDKISSDGRVRVRWLCECKCGNTTEVSTTSLKTGKAKSCGCLKIEAPKKRAKHNRSSKYNNKHYLYTNWQRIKDRCFNSNNKRYKDYGARGIVVYEPWVNNYIAFEKYILTNLGERPLGLTLDRINNNGNYEPGNLRWATNQTQTINTRIPKNNKSGVKGVYWRERDKKWVACIGVNYKTINLGSFLTKEEALVARMKAEEKYHKPLLT